MILIGINSAYHESAVALFEDNRLLFAIEEERLNRIKHGKKATVENGDVLPELSLELVKKHVPPREVDVVVFSFRPFLRKYFNPSPFDKETYIPKGNFGTEEGEELFYEKLKSSLRKLQSLFPKAEVVTLRHHLAHAFSAIATIPCETSGKVAFLTVDGIGEFETVNAGVLEGKIFKLLWRQVYPNSLGLLWEKITAFLGYTPMNDEPKIMALAAYGDPERFRKAFSEFLTVKEGKVYVDNRIVKLRSPDFSGLERFLGKRLEKFPEKDSEAKRQADIAATLQAITEDFFLQSFRKLRELTKAETIALAGGVALNCVSVGKVSDEGIFEKIWVQPAANDAGTAVGAPLWFLWKKGKDFLCPFKHLYLSPPVEVDESLFKRYPVNFEKLKNPELDAAEELKRGKVIGRFQGRMEFGPRALGNRSILANPLTEGIKDRLNLIKKRESYRPVACTVLEEFADEWFYIPDCAIPSLRNMNVAVRCKAKTRLLTPSVVHKNNTCRIQLLGKESPLLRKLIERFYRLTGIPFVINTSLNVSEPIVFSPEDALKTFLKAEGIDVLYIGEYKIIRK